MNKRLRRLLKRRQLASNSSDPDEKGKEKHLLTSLLAERPTARPNPYLRNRNKVNKDDLITEDDKKMDDKSVLFVKDTSESNEERLEVEINFEPMVNKSTNNVQTDENENMPTKECSSKKDKNLDKENANATLEKNSDCKTSANTSKKPINTFPIRTTFFNDSQASVTNCLKLYYNSEFTDSDKKHLFCLTDCQEKPKTSTSFNYQRISLTNSSISQSHGFDFDGCLKSELPIKDQNSSSGHLATLNSEQSCLQLLPSAKHQFVISPGCISSLCRTADHSSIQNQTCQSDDSTSLRKNRLPSSCKSKKPSLTVSTSKQSLQTQYEQDGQCHCATSRDTSLFHNTCNFTRESLPKSVDSFCSANENFIGEHRHSCWVSLKRQNHRPMQYISSTFDCNDVVFKSYFQCVSQQLPINLCQCEKEHMSSCKSIPSVVSFSVSGERRIIDFSNLIFSIEENSHCCCLYKFSQPTSKVFPVRTSRRHLKGERAFTDCSFNRMAPSMLFHQTQQDNFIEPSYTQCPCCHRIIRDTKPFSHQDPDYCNRNLLRPAVNSSLHQYKNGNISKSIQQKSFGQFEISQKSYLKLLRFIETKQLLSRKKSSVTCPTRQTTQSDILHSATYDNSELKFLNRKRSNAFNEYSIIGEQTEQLYCNQSVGEMVLLAKVLETVEECPWYWGGVSNAEAKAILKGKPIGTFILRDSSDTRFLFSMSVMTSRGPTSIRIVYANGMFRFDSDESSSQNSQRNSLSGRNSSETPQYRQCVAHMILHYTSHLQSNEIKNFNRIKDQTCSNSNDSASSSGDCANDNTDTSSDSNSKGHFMCSWMSQNGKRVMNIALRQPQPKRFLSLQQLSRSLINRHLELWKNTEKIQQLPLPSSLKQYLRKYPYPV